jgi:endonuclease-3 related protein
MAKRAANTLPQASDGPGSALAVGHSPTPRRAEGPLANLFDALFQAYGEQHWWPARTPFEIIVGAILVQNTTWVNAARAIENLRAAKLLTPAALAKVPQPRLARLIRSSGYFRQKARKLKAFLGFLHKEHRSSLQAMFAVPTAQLREQLLGVHGIGPETADSILLYAGNHPVFVIDAYTRRILKRHGLTHGKESYEELRGLFEKSLPRDARLFNEYHALIVHTGKYHCQARAALCSNCALRRFLPNPPEASA